MTPQNDSDIEFSKFGGHLAESLSFNKSIGQIYALLYVTPNPLALEDIAKRLSMSKGNASVNLRILEGWGAVHPVAVAGTRRDHYEANRNIKDLALRRMREGFGRRLDSVEDSLNRLTETNDAFQRKQIQELRGLISKARKGFDFLPKLLKVINW